MFVAGVFYLSTLAPTVLSYGVPDTLDSPMLQAAVPVLGVGHPTGYPTYTMLTRLFTYLPVGDVAYRVNLASAVYGVAAVAAVYVAGLLLSRRAAAAAAGSFAFGLSEAFWSQAVIAEVYTLNTLFFSLVLCALLLWRDRWDDRLLLLGAFLVGLSLTHHLSSVGTPDSSPWSAVNGSVTLNDLDGDGAGGTADSVKITIDYRYLTDDFKVVTTGNYGVAKRKIEATFKGVGAAGTGSGIGHPVYYTPSSIKLLGPTVTLRGISMISTRDILMPGLFTRSDFIADYDGASGGVFHVPNTPDELKDWNFTTYPAATRGFWNTVGRMGNPDVKQCKQSDKACELPASPPKGRYAVILLLALMSADAVRIPASPTGCTATTAPPDPA